MTLLNDSLKKEQLTGVHHEPSVLFSPARNLFSSCFYSPSFYSLIQGITTVQA
jgi:hypothetical protein